MGSHVAKVSPGDKNIRVNFVAPGAIDTNVKRSVGRNRPNGGRICASAVYWADLVSLKKLHKQVCWLASDQSFYVTGTVIHADAGYTRR
ncbi:SDR family oxidoreductase [Lentibacillus sp. N15]|uniref:SDR family oxidoreductase n=1 Tax=Lentibacillus songyuanensis TaxID=3136161 RepID=UPI0031BDB6A6